MDRATLGTGGGGRLGDLGPLTISASSAGAWAAGLTVQLAAASSVAAAGGQYADFIVKSATGQVLEQLSNLPTSDLGELAQLISGESSYFRDSRHECGSGLGNACSFVG